MGGLLAALMLLTASPALATRGQPDREVPFRAVSVGTSTDVFGPPPPECPGAAWQFFSSSMSEVAHLGLASVEVTHCSWIDGPGVGHFGPGTATFTAANGDTLTLSQWGTFKTVFDPGPVMSVAELEWVVIDGTGRFDGAGGSGTAVVVADLVANTSSSTYVGMIVYDASNAADH
jgi:hypothetical protein